MAENKTEDRPRYDPDSNYVVTGAYVTVKTGTERGPAFVGLYSGAPWPHDATADSGQHHLDNGLIAEIGKPAQVPVPLPAAPPQAVDPEAAGYAEPETPEERVTAERAQNRSLVDQRIAALRLQGSNDLADQEQESAERAQEAFERSQGRRRKGTKAEESKKAPEQEEPKTGGASSGGGAVPPAAGKPGAGGPASGTPKG